MTKSTEAVPATTGEAATTGKSRSTLTTVSGVGPGGWNDALLRDVLRVSGAGALESPGESRKMLAGLEAMKQIAPEDVIGDMVAAQLVAAQLVAAHEAAMRCYGQAADAAASGKGMHIDHWREYMNQANKLSRTTAALIEALSRHRGKSGQQTVRVEHVTVEAGGQAIVGAVATPGGEGG